MFVEPVMLNRRNFAYKPNVEIPVDFSNVYLPALCYVTVKVYFQLAPGSPKFYLRNPDDGSLFWFQGGSDDPVLENVGDITFTPPTPGLYTVEFKAHSISGSSVHGLWESEPISVLP